MYDCYIYMCVNHTGSVGEIYFEIGFFFNGLMVVRDGSVNNLVRES